ncbi:tripartite tricarboxylate transporter TctB family protein [Neotabrizicola sp. VNH66]|uniref:tripartite tricarboxylate transporter TctB family protein n=1 Tax=Neotabrizicola sp. VNH66 TaxID=3400918 RepID=UPI003C01D9D7
MQTNPILRREVMGGLVMALIGAGFLTMSLGYPFGTPRHIGAGVFPAIVAALLVLTGSVILLRGLLREGPRIGRLAWRPLALIAGSIAAFALLLPLAGFGVATVVMVLLSARAHPDFTWPGALSLAAVVTVFGGAVFIYGLGLPLPLVGPMLRF